MIEVAGLTGQPCSAISSGCAYSCRLSHTKVDGARINDLSVRSDFFLERNLKQLEFEEEITAHSFVVSID